MARPDPHPPSPLPHFEPNGGGGTRPLLIGVMGTTASGKTELAEGLADWLGAQLVNADAFQIYRGMDIGTAKPARKSDYKLLDLRDPSEGFGVGEFVPLAQEVLTECWVAQQSVVVVGGTGLYVRALFEEYGEMSTAPEPELRARLDLKPLGELVEELRKADAEMANRVDLKNRMRVQRALERVYSPNPSVPVSLPPFEKLKLGVIRDPEELSERITRRVQAMMQNGWVREVEELISAGYSDSDPGFRALGYRAIWQYLHGQIPLHEAQATAIADTKRYAKRQRTWLRAEPKLLVLDSGDAFEEAQRLLSPYI